MTTTIQVVYALTLLVILTNAVTFYNHAFSSQHLHRHDGPHQKVYIHVHKHEAPKKEEHKKEEHKHVDYYVSIVGSDQELQMIIYVSV